MAARVHNMGYIVLDYYAGSCNASHFSNTLAWGKEAGKKLGERKRRWHTFLVGVELKASKTLFLS